MDKFYFDDDTGLSLFGKVIADFKGKINYQDLINEKPSNQNVVPVRKEKDVD